MKHIERFAPSPTGPLHLGHAFSALTAWDRSLEEGGDFLLRIEDIDQSRARPQWEAQIYEDLEWLGIWWPKPILHQSDRMDVYRTALQSLWDRDLLYPCICTRRDLELAISAPQEGIRPQKPHQLCHSTKCGELNKGLPVSMTEMPSGIAIRLNMGLATLCRGIHAVSDTPGGEYRLGFSETGLGNVGWQSFASSELASAVGDIVLAGKETGTSYHLSVVLDDAFQNVTHVTRGEDLFEATKIHVLLQNLLGLSTPTYHHHRLIRDENGKRLAKRDDARAISKFRAEGASPQDIRRLVGLPPS